MIINSRLRHAVCHGAFSTPSTLSGSKSACVGATNHGRGLKVSLVEYFCASVNAENKKKCPVAYFLSALRKTMCCVSLGELQRVSTDKEKPCIVGTESNLCSRWSLETVRNALGSVGC